MTSINTKELEFLIGYNFKNKKLLHEALTHSSYANENKNTKFNERLEFLGDSVLSLIISTYLFDNCPNHKEGDLSRIRASIVCEKSLRIAGDIFFLNKFLFIGKGEEISGGRNKDSILADAFESLIGAIYLDSGLNDARIFIFKFMEKIINKALEGKLFEDYKTQFQELVRQKDKYSDINYVVVNTSGPDHEKVFTVCLYMNNIKLSTGVGKSKKEAEQNAAKEALKSCNS